MNIWDFSTRLTRRLLIWSALSILLSSLTAFLAQPLLRGLAIQFFVWGVIDGAIALFGARASAGKRAKVNEAERRQVEKMEVRWLSRVLWINTGLDVLYVLGGFWLMQTWGIDNPLWRGHSIGIMIQGGFLFFFDLFHALALQNLRTT